MNYYLSIDGGGTKTAFLLTDEYGKAIGTQITKGFTYSEMGSELIYKLLRESTYQMLAEYRVLKEELLYVVWGISCFGEYRDFDADMNRTLPKLFGCDCYICNDVEIAMAGSLLLQSGIHIIAGTGAIIMGKNEDGKIARANGWHETFSDEGSAYWLGVNTLSLFTRQADGREVKSFMYQLLYQHFDLQEDMDIVSYYKNHLEGKRDRVASLQKILLEAAKLGDNSAINLYVQAAKELTSSVFGVARTLQLQERKTKVSYYGGVFKAGLFIKDPLNSYLGEQEFQLYEPILTPLSGGILIAMEKCHLERKNQTIENLKNYEKGNL